MAYVKDQFAFTRGVGAIAASDARNKRATMAKRKAQARLLNLRDAQRSALGAFNTGGFATYQNQHVGARMPGIDGGPFAPVLPPQTPPHPPMRPGPAPVRSLFWQEIVGNVAAKLRPISSAPQLPPFFDGNPRPISQPTGNTTQIPPTGSGSSSTGGGGGSTGGGGGGGGGMPAGGSVNLPPQDDSPVPDGSELAPDAAGGNKTFLLLGAGAVALYFIFGKH